MEIGSFSISIKIRLVLHFLTTFTNNMVMPFVVVFFVGKVGATSTTWMTICIGIAGIIGYIIGGKLADRYGRKKFILIGELFTGIGFIIVAIANVELVLGTFISFIGFIVVYFFSSLSQPAYSAFIIDETTKENRRNVYTVLMWSFYLSSALGSLLGGFLFHSFATSLFILTAVSSFVSFICIAIFIEDRFIIECQKKVMTSASNHQSGNTYKQMLKHSVFLYIALITFIFTLMDEQLFYYFSIRFVELFSEDGYSLLGFLRTENTLLAVCLTIFVAKIMKKVKDINALLIGGGLFFVGYIILSVSHLPIIAVAAMAVVTIGEIIFLPTKQAIQAGVVPDEFRSTYSSILGVVSTIGGVFASLFVLLAYYISPLGITIMYSFIGLVMIYIIQKLKSYIPNEHAYPEKVEAKLIK